ncbi:MAG: pyruvate kinase [Dehalococcoidia bacterium]
MNKTLNTLHNIRKTKIVCTIGPNSNKASNVEALFKSGMDIARINFSHGTDEEHVRDIETIRRAAKKLRIPVAILQDLPGPKDRTGNVREGGVLLKEGQDFILTTRQVLGDEKKVTIDWPEIGLTCR